MKQIGGMGRRWCSWQQCVLSSRQVKPVDQEDADAIKKMQA
jgi:hypothetical protein